MINKKSLWFLTLFSLIIVLSIYYITMPSELLISNKNKDKQNDNDQIAVNIEESDLLVALRVESDSEMESELETLKTVLTNEEKTTDEKNQAYEKIKSINNIRSEEENLEKKLKDELNINSFIKIDNDQIKVTIESDTHDTKLANDIIRSIQNNYKTYKYITVKFEK